MTEYTCRDCGSRTGRTLNVFAHTKCPSCGSEGTLVETKLFEKEKEYERSRLEILAQLHFEPADWKAVAVSAPLFGESQNAGKVERILNKMAGEGWEFVSFGDSPRLVDGPVMIFKRQQLKPASATA